MTEMVHAFRDVSLLCRDMMFGGATDLFVARVPYYIIQHMGRWASDAALVNYRHEEDVLRAVSTAFRYVANPTRGWTPIYREGGVVV